MSRWYIEYLYMTIMWPVLQYCKCVWTYHQDKYILKLEGFQTFAARFVARQRHASSDSLQNDLHWPLLSPHCSFHKLCLCRWILCVNHQYHHLPLFLTPLLFFVMQILATSFNLVLKLSHRHSFFLSVVLLWNTDPAHTPLNLYLAFRKYL